MEYLGLFDYIDDLFIPCLCFILYTSIVLYILYGKNAVTCLYNFIHNRKILIFNKNIKNPFYIKRKNKGISIIISIILIYIIDVVRKYILFIFPVILMTSYTNTVLVYSGEEALANVWSCFPELDFYQLSLYIVQYGESISTQSSKEYMIILFTFFALLIYIGLFLFVFFLLKKNRAVYIRASIVTVLSIFLYFGSTIFASSLYGKDINQYTNYANITYANGKIDIDESNKYYYNEIVKLKEERESLPFKGTFYYDIGLPILK